MKITRLAGLLLVLLLAGSPAIGAEQPRGALWTVADGQGTVSLFWVPRDLAWPTGGWRLEKISQGKPQVLAESIGPGSDAAAMARLSDQDRTAIESFRVELLAGAIPAQERELAITIMGLRAASNLDFGLALGLRYRDTGVSGGGRSYRLTALDSKGKPLAVMNSAPVDPGTASPLPEAPQAVAAVLAESGVELAWHNPAQNPLAPVLGYVVEREDAAGDKVQLTEQPQLITPDGAEDENVRFVDLAPPREMTTTYQVSSVDLFGRKSRSQAASLFIPDLSALTPPQEFTAIAGKNLVELAWQLNQSPFTSGYVIERSLLREGPFLVLTPEGLNADQAGWVDKQLVGGTSYFYRVRAMDPRGKLGNPSPIAAATPENRQAPPRPENLRAEVGRTRVRLTWDAVQFPVAGYLVERKAKDAARWVLITASTVPEGFFDDHVGLHTQGEFRYRVSAVAFDNQQSKPSREVKAELLDTVSPNPPRITAIDGSDGQVTLTFEAASPQEDVDSFLVVRAVSEQDPGLVLGDPLPASKHRFVDTFVTVGQKYWYRLVAVDRSGNRSDLGWAREVTVLNPPVPVPPRPVLTVVAEPLRHVRIAFNPPPTGFEVIVQRQSAERGWLPLTGGIRDATEAVDLNPPEQPGAYYRLVYRAANGVAGLPSPAVEAKFD